MASLDSYQKTGVKPDGPSASRGYLLTGTKPTTDDSARYILRPDIEFYRPWLGSAGAGGTGLAFVWPLGIEGFTFSSTPELGIHKYIGDNNIDVEVIYPDEYHVTLTGIFPGLTSAQNMRALRATILHEPIDGAKTLSLPLVSDTLLTVSVVTYNFTRDETDGTSTIQYSVEFIQQAVGAKQKLKPLQPPKPNPTNVTTPRGKATKRKVIPHSPTARGVAAEIYRDPSQQSLVLAKNLSKIHMETGIPAHQLGYRRLPAGTILDT